MVIWKYSISTNDNHNILMPTGSIPCYFNMQNGSPCIWSIILDPAAQKIDYHFILMGTGKEYEIKEFKYIGSCKDGAFIWHLLQILIPNIYIEGT